MSTQHFVLRVCIAAFVVGPSVAAAQSKPTEKPVAPGVAAPRGVPTTRVALPTTPPQPGTAGTQGSPPPPPPKYWATASPAQGNSHTRITLTHSLGFPERRVNLNPPPGFGWPGFAYVSNWTATSAVVQLRYMPGVPQYSGTIDVELELNGTNVIHIPFTWVPQLETKEMTLLYTFLDQSTFPNSDTHLTGPGAQQNYNQVTYEFNGLFGGKGDDEIFRNVHLSPGWSVVSARVEAQATSGHANATLVDSRPGSNSPYVKVHWWADPFSSLRYFVYVTVKGPEGGEPCPAPACPHHQP